MQHIITDEFRSDLKKLVAYLTNNPDLQWIDEVIDQYEPGEDDDEFDDDDNYAMNQEELINTVQRSMLGEILEPEFMLHLDWKEDIEELKLGIEILVQNNFGINRIKLPKLRNYGERTGLANDDVFDDFQRELKKQGFSLANIQSEDDTFWIIVFPTTSINAIKHIFDRLGMTLEYV